MISHADAKKLKLLVVDLRDADDLSNRYSYGHTNATGDEVNRKHRLAVEAFESFVKSITEE